MNRRFKVHWIFRSLLTLAYAGAIYAVSSEDTSSIDLPPYTDKIIHFVEFGLLCLLTCWSLSSAKIGTKGIYKIILAIGITSLYGMSDEFHQIFTPHRSVELLDWLADSAGAVAAGLFWQMSVYKLQVKEKSLAMDKTVINM